MLTRDLVMPLFVAGAIGVPWMMSTAGNDPRISAGNPAAFNTAGTIPGPGMTSGVTSNLHGRQTWVFPGDQNGPDFSAGPLEFMPIQDLTQVFRMEMAIDEIRSRYPRISLVTSETGWQGYRTELVTGTGTQDLHGCITWYFDGSQKMQRITFRGWTGEHRNLKEFLARHFLLGEKPTDQWSELMTLESWGNASCVAIFQLPAVMRQQNQQQQVAVLIELNRSSSQEISPATQNAARF